MTKSGSVSRPELLQFLGFFPLAIGCLLVFCIVIGRLLIWVVPTFGTEWARRFAETGVDIDNHPFQAILLAVSLITLGGGIMLVAGFWAQRNERLLRERLRLLRASLKRYRADRGDAAQSLSELVELGYLRRVPSDPMRWPSKKWDEVRASPKHGISDVRTRSRSSALDGSLYSSW